MERPIFIVGLPRTGSTLWHNIFARNVTLCRMGEMHYLTPFRKDFRHFIKESGILTDETNVRKMFDLIFSDKITSGITEAFWKFDIGKVNSPDLKETMIKKVIESDKSLESFFKIITENFALFNKKERCCIKFPVYANFIPKLIEWYPDCKIVHIIRDPRAIAVSRKNDPGGTRKKKEKYPYLSFFIQKAMVLYVVFQYIWVSKLHRSFTKYNNYKVFKYEDLLSDPERTIKSLCNHTEVEFVEGMLHPKEGQTSSITDKKAEGFDRTAAFRWKNHITPFENRLVTLLTKSSMRRFNYHPEEYTDLN